MLPGGYERETALWSGGKCQGTVGISYPRVRMWWNWSHAGWRMKSPRGNTDWTMKMQYLMAEGFGMIEKTLVCSAFQDLNTEKLAKVRQLFMMLLHIAGWFMKRVLQRDPINLGGCMGINHEINLKCDIHYMKYLNTCFCSGFSKCNWKIHQQRTMNTSKGSEITPRAKF